MRIVAFELIVGDVVEVTPTRTGASGERDDAWVPAIFVAHIDPPGDLSTTPDAASELRFEHVDNLLSRFFRWGGRRATQLLQELNTTAESAQLITYGSGGFCLKDRNGDAEACVGDVTAQSPIRLLASGDAGSSASFPMYWMLTDAAPGEDEDSQRWDDDISFYEHAEGGGTKMGLSPCERAERRLRRSRALAELKVRPWAYVPATEVVTTMASDPPLDWRNWDVAFSRSGAGFAHAAENGASSNRHRCDDLSTVYIDLVALDMLKDRVIQRFSELTRELASEMRRDASLREQCVEAWKALVTFTSEYFGRTAGLEQNDRDFLEAFRSGAGLDLEKDLSSVHANLERLAQVSRMELDEESSRRGRARDAADRRFDRLISIFAAIVIPFTVVPPIVEWCVELPSAAGAIAGIFGIVVIGAAIALVLWRRLRSPRSTHEP